MSEGKDLILEDEIQDQCQLSVDTENRCLILEFSKPIEVFGFDVETAEGLRDAIDKGLKIIARLDS